MTLLIMAAGLGSRYGGNKQVDGLGPNNEILMQYSIYDAMKAGFERVVLVIKPEHKEIVSRLCKSIKGVSISYVYQDYTSLPTFYSVPQGRQKPFGTVHAVLCAAEAICEPFAIINADDYYGPDAYRVMAHSLRDLREHEGVMVTYRLKNTVSRNGAVTRGICTEKDGYLAGVREAYRVTLGEDGRIADENGTQLSPLSAVSMNMWGFTPAIFESIRQEFHRFLASLDAEDSKAEYALPTMVDHLLGNGSLSVRMLMTDSVWFGVTYAEDKPLVQAALRALHEDGTYPTPLFG